MNVSMAECNISATHLNASTIEYNLALSTLESTDPNGSFTDENQVLPVLALIYRYQREFSMEFKCYLTREASFSSDGWTIVSSNTSITTGFRTCNLTVSDIHLRLFLWTAR